MQVDEKYSLLLFALYFLSSSVPVVITELRVVSGPHCLPSGTSVDIQCVNSGFPQLQIVFFRGTEQITPGQGSFEHFTQVSFDIVRLSGARKDDSGDYVCEARMGTKELNQSRPVRLVFCSKCWSTAFILHQLLSQLCLSPPQLHLP